MSVFQQVQKCPV